MAAITTRATSAAGATVKGGALTAAEMDANFLNINDEIFVDGLPTVKPSLVLDFIGGAQIDPRITFTRASTATFYDASSTAKAEENLLTNSVHPLSAGWVLFRGFGGSAGSELVTNGTFASGTAGWSAASGTSFSVANGEATLTTGTNYEGLEQTINGLVVGAFYRVRGYVKAGSYTGSIAVGVDGIGWGNVVNGPTDYALVEMTFRSSLTSQKIKFTQYNNSSTGQTFFVDNVSLVRLTADNATAPNGSATAVTLTASLANAVFTQSVNVSAGDHTFSVWLRRVSGTGNIDITAHSGGTWVTQTITSSWARYTVTQTLTAGARTPGIRIVTSGDQIEVWGAQLEQRSAATAYTPTTTQPITNYVPQLLTAPANTPRFDHNPTTNESLGLLIEEQRTNNLTYSANFSNAIWFKGNSSITAGTIVAPDGTLSGNKLVEDATTNTHVVYQNYAAPSSNLAVTLSVYAKAGEITRIQLQAGGTNRTFDLVAGATSGGSGASMVSVGNGWWRCISTQTIPDTVNRSYGIALDNGTTTSYAGNGFNGAFIWGAQLEAGAFPTSYIPTVASSVTRSADAASMTGTNFSSWYNQEQGTFCAQGDAFALPAATSSNTFFSINDGTASNYQSIYTFGNNGYAATVTGGAIQANPGVTTVTLTDNQVYKAVYAYQVNNFGYTVNGATVVTDTLGSVPPATQANIGSRITASSLPLNGHIRSITYYPRRLSNTQLQYLTK